MVSSCGLGWEGSITKEGAEAILFLLVYAE